jgi:hypothetical protein
MNLDQALHQIGEMGLLRNLLHILAIFFILVLPFSEPKRILEGWDLFLGGIVPATAPLIFVVMMFDVMMCQIMKGDGPEENRARYTRIVRTHLALGIILISLWLLSFESVLFG